MKNIRFIFLLLLVIGSTASCSKTVSEEEYISRAKAYIGEGDISSATIELKNILRINADNAEARLLLGQTHLQAGDLRAAEKELLRAKELGVEQNAVTPDLSKVFLRQGKLGEVLLLEHVGLNPDRKVVVLASKALAKQSQGEVDDALKLLEEARASGIQSNYVQVAFASLLFAKEDITGARKLVDSVLKSDPSSASAWSLLANMEVREKQLEAAITAFSNAINNQAANWRALEMRALLFIRQRKFEKAQADISLLKTQFPKRPFIQYLQGLAYFYTEKLNEAVIAFDLASAYPDNLQNVSYYLAMTHFRLGSIEQADKAAEQLYTAAPEYVTGVKLYASIKLLRKQPELALSALQVLVDKNKDDIEALNLLARAYAQVNKHKQAADLLTRVVELSPESDDAVTNLGISLLLDGQETLGLSHLKTAIKLNPLAEKADATQVMYLLKKGQYSNAMAAAEGYRDRNSALSEPMNLIGLTYLAQKKTDEAVAAFVRSNELEPGNPQAGLSLAALAVKKKDYAEARDLLGRVLDKSPTHLPTLMRIVQLDALEGKRELVVEHLNVAIKAHKQAIGPRLAMANHYLFLKQYGLIPGLFDDAMSSNVKVLAVILQAQLAQKNYYAAQKIVATMVKVAPDSPVPFYFESLIFAGLKEPAKSHASILTALDKDQEYHPARLVLAHQLLFQGKLEEAKAQAVILRQRLPKDMRVMRFSYDLFKVSKETQRALDIAKELYVLYPTRRHLRVLSDHYLLSGMKDAGLSVLKEWEASHPVDVVIRIYMAGLFD